MENLETNLSSYSPSPLFYMDYKYADFEPIANTIPKSLDEMVNELLVELNGDKYIVYNPPTGFPTSTISWIDPTTGVIHTSSTLSSGSSLMSGTSTSLGSSSTLTINPHTLPEL